MQNTQKPRLSSDVLLDISALSCDDTTFSFWHRRPKQCGELSVSHPLGSREAALPGGTEVGNEAAWSVRAVHSAVRRGIHGPSQPRAMQTQNLCWAGYEVLSSLFLSPQGGSKPPDGTS